VTHTHTHTHTQTHTVSYNEKSVLNKKLQNLFFFFFKILALLHHPGGSHNVTSHPRGMLQLMG